VVDSGRPPSPSRSRADEGAAAWRCEADRPKPPALKPKRLGDGCCDPSLVLSIPRGADTANPQSSGAGTRKSCESPAASRLSRSASYSAGSFRIGGPPKPPPAGPAADSPGGGPPSARSDRSCAPNPPAGSRSRSRLPPGAASHLVGRPADAAAAASDARANGDECSRAATGTPLRPNGDPKRPPPPALGSAALADPGLGTHNPGPPCV
jgi:hypothetical protein